MFRTPISTQQSSLWPRAVSLVLTLGLIACAGESPSSPLPETPSGGGPVVVFDLTAKPLPEIPLPNDVATRIDSRSPTGRFVNVSKIAPTFLESDLRAKASHLDGFAGFMPITVPFSAPLDLMNIRQRHVLNDDLSDDAIYVIDVDPNSPEQGRIWPLDVGTGNFPIGLEKRNNYFANDSRVVSSNLLFETVDEDQNNNGVLDPGEDTDGDGHLDRGNYLEPERSAASFLPEGFEMGQTLCESEGLQTDDFRSYEDLMTFWEGETNTLIIRPLLPLRPGTRYAVVLTERLVDPAGQAIRSPWAARHHASQALALEPLPELLAKNNIDPSEVAFAWTYTTSTATREMEWIRAGLYGHGKMAYLAEEYPVNGIELVPVTTLPDSVYYARGEDFQLMISLVLSEITDEAPAQAAIRADFEHVGGVTMGSFQSPSFLVDRDGYATPDYPANDDEIFEIDPVTGEAPHGPEAVTWWCILPKRAEGSTDPFPTVIYGHGYTSSRVEALGFAGRVARAGMATCALDAFGHGFEEPNGTVEFGGEDLSYRELLTTVLGQLGPLGPFGEALFHGRARDLDNDGLVDSGGDFWTADIFHTRDVVRQSIADHLQFIRILRSFDGDRTWVYDTNGDGFGNLAGDLDGDGIVDIGGPGDNYFMMGGSLGGILTGIVAGIEPAIVAAAPVAGGAGLIDIGVRSRQGGVPQAVLLPIIGPFVLGNPTEGGGTSLEWLVNSVNDDERRTFGVLESPQPGDRVEVLNLSNGESNTTVVPNSGRFRIPIAADALTATERRPWLGLGEEDVTSPALASDPTVLGDRIEVRVYAGDTGRLVESLSAFGQDVVFQGTLYPEGAPLVAIAKGLGRHRNSPDFRRLMGISQMILESGDPISFAPHYDDPLDFSYDPGVTPGANVLVIPSIGDMNVPVNAGIQMARAAGMIEISEANPRYEGSIYEGMSDNRVLIETYTLEGVECLPRWRNEAGEPVLFDIDDLDFGTDPFGEPSMTTEGGVAPLRLNVPATHSAGGVHGLRVPLVAREGTHGFNTPEPNRAFDINNYMNNLVSYYFHTRGQELPDDPCLEDSSCTVAENGFALPFEQAPWESQDWNADSDDDGDGE